MKDSIKVAGVTFANPDGTSRQELLASLGRGFRTAKLKQTTYDGERAVEVRINGKFIGYVPKTQLTNPLSFEQELTAYIDIYKNKFFAVLSARVRPSSKEYVTMKTLCAKAGKPMPAYDRRAYAQYWATVNA